MLPASIALPLLYIPLGRPWVLSNLLALCLSTATLALLRLDSFLTAGVLLGVLLIYDIFWVRVSPLNRAGLLHDLTTVRCGDGV
jgi:minor histocompatibility antigen H13